MTARAPREFWGGAEVDRCLHLSVDGPVVVAGNVGVGHTAVRGDPTVGELEALHQRFSGIDGAVAVGVEEPFD